MTASMMDKRLPAPGRRATGGRFRSMRARTVACTLMATALGAGCAAPAAPTLYERMGGMPAIEALSAATIERSATDPRTRRSFEGIRLSTLSASLAEQLCAVADGPCRYQGETMARAHADHRITEAEFDAMVGILREELDARVGTAEKNALLRRLAPMKREVVAP